MHYLWQDLSECTIIFDLVTFTSKFDLLFKPIRLWKWWDHNSLNLLIFNVLLWTVFMPHWRETLYKDFNFITFSIILIFFLLKNNNKLSIKSTGLKNTNKKTNYNNERSQYSSVIMCAPLTKKTLQYEMQNLSFQS